MYYSGAVEVHVYVRVHSERHTLHNFDSCRRWLFRTGYPRSLQLLQRCNERGSDNHNAVWYGAEGAALELGSQTTAAPHRPLTL